MSVSLALGAINNIRLTALSHYQKNMIHFNELDDITFIPKVVA